MVHQRHLLRKVVEWACLSALYTVIVAQDLKSSGHNTNDLDYKFLYLIRDDSTGDYKTQEESKVGDVVNGRYTVAEPNGDLRVVTYLADQHSGFRAHVQIQPGGVSAQKANDHTWGFPRFVRKTGTFPAVPNPENKGEDIDEDEIMENSENGPLKVKGSPEEYSPNTNSRSEEVEAPIAKTSSESGSLAEANIELKRIRKEKRDTSVVKSAKQDANEGRAHIRPDEDKVQFEMEQVIRAEMQDPMTVKLGVPIDEHKHLHDAQGKYQMASQHSDITQESGHRKILRVQKTMRKSDSAADSPSNSTETMPEGNEGRRKQRNFETKPPTGFGFKIAKNSRQEATDPSRESQLKEQEPEEVN